MISEVGQRINSDWTTLFFSLMACVENMQNLILFSL